MLEYKKHNVYCKNGIAGINERKEECVIEVLKDLVPIHIEIED